MEYLIGIDIGTYESKGALVDRDGRLVATSAVAHEMSIPKPGWAEHDADAVWWHDFVVLARDLIRLGNVSPSDIAGVCCSAIGPCVLPVGKDGRPLRPAILYGIDTRAIGEVGELTNRLAEDWVLEQTGSSLSSQAAGPKILWLRRNEPDVWRRTEKIMTSTSYLVYRLTGRVVIDHYTAGAYGPLYNVHDHTWDPRALEYVCDESKLPELEWSAATAGTVSRQAAEETGLREGTPVSVGTADAASEAIAAGVLEPGDTMLMYGSTLFFIQICSELPKSRTLWPTVYLEPGAYALAAGMSTTGALTRWFRDNFASAEVAAENTGAANAYEVLATEASRVPAGSGGLMMLPYFSGERSPINDPLARGVIAGLTLSHTRAHLYRALLEGVAYGIRQNLETMTETGAAPGRLVAIGGGVKNPLWIQIVSDVTGRAQIVQTTPGASYGDAILAAIGAGILEDMSAARRWLEPGTLVAPDPRAAAFYDGKYPLYCRLYEQTKEIAHVLAADPERII